jgi:hypothetical protein
MREIEVSDEVTNDRAEWKDGHAMSSPNETRAGRRRSKHTYHSHFIPKGVAETSLIFLGDTHILPK